MAAGLFPAHSNNPDTKLAFGEVSSSLPLNSAEFVLLLHGPNHTGEDLVTEMGQTGDTCFFGCSTSGEISPKGYDKDSMIAISFDRDAFSCVSRKIQGLGEFGFKQARELLLSMQWELQQRSPGADRSNTFALLLIDSQSKTEEFVAAALGSELGTIPLIGASSGDNWNLNETPVIYKGLFADDSAVLLLVHARLDFKCYNFHNFKPSERRGVITSATPQQRLVHEINGAPALQEYVRLCGGDPTSADQAYLATYPAIITVGDRAYPRGFLEILDDGSLRLACAIDEGVVFRVAEQVDYIAQLQSAFERMHQDLGEKTLVLGFECAARRQQAEQQDLEDEVAKLFSSANVWGFSCMGEQANALHMNNSFNCLVFKLPS